ncbi:MAG: electron transfer flavoprotein subunit beta/FixA family protein [Candidatus Lokiarchaeota archaeon]|nr:electron transfer flavoprotein subunit beta/FixA family protein [Candidatus Lokiarchaeota archaeon]
MINIFVLIKQVPETHDLQINRATGTIIRDGIENIINQDDLYGLELGLSLKEKYGGQVTAITMGPPHAESALRECLAMGVDHAILLSDPVFAYSDTLQTTLVLKETFDTIKDYDIIITGTKTSDSSTGQVPYQLSEALEIPLITDIFSLDIDNKNNLLMCHRNFGHESQNIEVELPVLLRINRYFNEPRHVSLSGIKKAYSKEIEVIDYRCLNSPSCIDGRKKSPTRVIKTEKPEQLVRKKSFIEGTTTVKVKKIIELMTEHGIERIWTGSHSRAEDE